ncbi:hypothetical protein Tcan_05306 [Toxocara canis]|uniref:G_PROTEIN_RECEP_F1_2 domain-containing protein n=1 Tax=Toxocara canis TaxID=6265 RepID=A0A0B2W5W0_TOXCA|nr:hypothetical protein Tcan_05306 [Toxocara canis]
MWSSIHICNNTMFALLQPLTYLSLFVSSSINPFLYAFFSHRFRDAVYDIICRRTYRKQSFMSSRRTRTIISECADDSRSSSLARSFRMTTLSSCDSRH